MLSRVRIASASTFKGFRLAALALKILPPTSVGPRHASQNHPGQPEEKATFRHGFMPEEFFQYLYPKTGVTGPYVLGTGFTAYLLSKEMFVLSSETIGTASIAAALIYGMRTYGPQLTELAVKMHEEELEKIHAEEREAELKAHEADEEKVRQMGTHYREGTGVPRGEARSGLSGQLAPYEVLHEASPHDETGREERRAEFHSTAGEEKGGKAPRKT